MVSLVRSVVVMHLNMLLDTVRAINYYGHWYHLTHGFDVTSEVNGHMCQAYFTNISHNAMEFIPISFSSCWNHSVYLQILNNSNLSNSLWQTIASQLLISVLGAVYLRTQTSCLSHLFSNSSSLLIMAFMIYSRQCFNSHLTSHLSLIS